MVLPDFLLCVFPLTAGGTVSIKQADHVTELILTDRISLTLQWEEARLYYQLGELIEFKKYWFLSDLPRWGSQHRRETLRCEMRYAASE